MTIAGFIATKSGPKIFRRRKGRGGTRPYQICERDTVEEKIPLLQNRKRAIIQATIGGEDEFAAALNWDDIQELLA